MILNILLTIEQAFLFVACFVILQAQRQYILSSKLKNNIDYDDFARLHGT
jgi:hypothetical protein